jgi:hypothetical protein
MSRIFEDNDAKALVLVSALLLGVIVLGSFAAPKHKSPSLVANSMSAQQR